MKRGMLLLLAVGILLGMGAGNRPILTPGVYQVKPGNTWKKIAFDKNSKFGSRPKYFSSKLPDGVKLELPAERFASFSFARFSLGNNGTEYTLVIGSQNSYYFDTLYIDRNRDGIVTTKEEVKMNERQNIAMGYTFQELEAETGLEVDYRTSTGQNIRRTLDISLVFYYGKFADEPVIFYMVVNKTLLEGTGLSGGEPLIFTLADRNGNGLYNDYGIDLVFYDKNHDGKFQYKKEHQILNPLHNLKIGRDNGIYRFIVPDFPRKIGLIDAEAAYNIADFE